MRVPPIASLTLSTLEGVEVFFKECKRGRDGRDQIPREGYVTVAAGRCVPRGRWFTLRPLSKGPTTTWWASLSRPAKKLHIPPSHRPCLVSSPTPHSTALPVRPTTGRRTMIAIEVALSAQASLRFAPIPDALLLAVSASSAFQYLSLLLPPTERKMTIRPMNQQRNRAALDSLFSPGTVCPKTRYQNHDPFTRRGSGPMNQSPPKLGLFWAGPYQIMTNDQGTDLGKPFSLSLSLSLLRAALPRGGGKTHRVSA